MLIFSLQLKIHCYREDKDMMAKVGFIGRPDIKVVGKPVNPYLVSIIFLRLTSQKLDFLARQI